MSPENQNDANDGEPEPPDGGWGWVVVFASFMMNFIIWGILNTSGVLYVELLEDLKTGKGQTAWISSLAFGTLMSTSPVSSALSNAYGNRCISIVGSLVSSIGFIVSGFARNIYFLYISLGIIVGAGLGLTFLPFLVCLNHYFGKRRSLAVGLSVCGTGVGTFVWAPVVEILIGNYGWRGTTLILAGATLNLTVLGALLRLLRIPKHETKDLLDSKTKISNNRKLKCVTEHRLLNHSSKNEDKDSFEVPVSDSDKLLPPQNQVHLDEGNAITHKSTETERVTTANNRCKDYFKQAIKHYDFSLFKNAAFLIFLLSNFTIMLGINAPYVYLPDRSHEKGISKTDSALFISVIGVANTIGRITLGWLADRKWVNRRILYTASMVICGTVTLLNPLSDSYIYLMSYSVVYGSFMGVFSSLYITILVDLLGLRKLSNALGLIMMVRGIASFIGSPAAGGFHCLYVIILVDLLGLKKLSNALGIVIFVQGIASFVGPPAAGWLYDITGSYDTSFYCIGVVVVVGGLLLCFIPLAENMPRDKTHSDVI